jgi:hypothetical protein
MSHAKNKMGWMSEQLKSSVLLKVAIYSGNCRAGILINPVD